MKICGYKILLLLFCLAIAVHAKPVNTGVGLKPLHGHRQLMIVLTSGWGKVQGNLYCFNLKGGKWHLTFTNLVVVGSKGMAIGDGIIPVEAPEAPIKKEGDMKSPAGMFTIGTAFGYTGAKNAGWIRNRYIKATDTLICVDDAQSPDYNKLVQSDTVRTPYNSHEDMHRKDSAYKWGLFVNHNANETVPGSGSCIFIHIWRDANHGTAGCTAMSESNILRLLHWINAENKPLLIQMPRSLYQKVKTQCNLPSIN